MAEVHLSPLLNRTATEQTHQIQIGKALET
jgi:hypothetical protein